MVALLVALLIVTGQDAGPVAAEPEVEATKASEPEKICKSRKRQTGEGGIKGTQRYKVCKTKEEWDRLKSSSRD